MQPNPFEPPSESADLALDAPAGTARGIKVYSPNQIFLATFLGSLIGGSLLLAENYRAFGKPTAAWQTVVAGVALTLGMIGAFAFAHARPRGIPFLIALAARALVSALQGKDVTNALVHGAVKHSSWRAAGIGLVSLIVVFFVAVAAGYFSTRS